MTGKRRVTRPNNRLQQALMPPKKREDQATGADQTYERISSKNNAEIHEAQQSHLDRVPWGDMGQHRWGKKVLLLADLVSF